MNKLEKNQLLKSYIPYVDFMANVTGKKCEVVLRSFHEGESDIIYIVNGHLSGRKVGDSVTGYALKKIMKADYRSNNYVTNYIMINEINQKVFRASTYYIKEAGELIGLISINYDLTDYLKFRDFYNEAVLYGIEESPESNSKDYFGDSLDDITEAVIHNVLIYWDRSIPIRHIYHDDNPIRQMYNLGVFKYKGAVNKVAEMLDISIQTIYRYIKNIESSNERVKKEK